MGWACREHPALGPRGRSGPQALRSGASCSNPPVSKPQRKPRASSEPCVLGRGLRCPPDGAGREPLQPGFEFIASAFGRPCLSPNLQISWKGEEREAHRSRLASALALTQGAETLGAAGPRARPCSSRTGSEGHLLAGQGTGSAESGLGEKGLFNFPDARTWEAVLG